MTESTVPAGQLMAQRWLRTQSLVALVLAVLAFLVAGRVAAYSSVFGSLAAFVPAVAFAMILARRVGSDSGVFLGAAVVAEMVKWLLCAGICVAVFVGVEPLAAGWFFTGMGLVILAGWLGLFFTR